LALVLVLVVPGTASAASLANFNFNGPATLYPSNPGSDCYAGDTKDPNYLYAEAESDILPLITHTSCKADIWTPSVTYTGPTGGAVRVDFKGTYFSWGFRPPVFQFGYMDYSSKIDVEFVDWTAHNYMYDWTLGQPVIGLTCATAYCTAHPRIADGTVGSDYHTSQILKSLPGTGMIYGHAYRLVVIVDSEIDFGNSYNDGTALVQTYAENMTGAMCWGSTSC
jgi:hypothetical protein